MKKLFVGNLDWGMTSEDLRATFEQFGDVEDAVVISDRETGRSKGFGFVTFANAEDADKATAELDGTELSGRPVVVNEARPREDR